MINLFLILHATTFFGDDRDIPILLDVDTLTFVSDNNDSRFRARSSSSPTSTLFIIGTITLNIAVRNDAEGVNDTGNPTENGQADVDEDWTGAAAAMQTYGKWWEEDCPENFTTVHESDSHFSS